MLTKSESMNFVTSCHQVESCVLDIPVEKVWENFRSFRFDKLFPNHIKSVKFTSGSPNEVGSLFETEYADGSVWTKRIIEVSEVRRSLSWELISTNNDISFTSMMTTVRFHKVTEDNRTFVLWETDFSNDVNAHIVQDGKYKKLDYFKELRKIK